MSTPGSYTVHRCSCMHQDRMSVSVDALSILSAYTSLGPKRIQGVAAEV